MAHSQPCRSRGPLAWDQGLRQEESTRKAHSSFCIPAAPVSVSTPRQTTEVFPVHLWYQIPKAGLDSPPQAGPYSVVPPRNYCRAIDSYI